MSELCEDCPPKGYPTNKTRCASCPRSNVRGRTEFSSREIERQKLRGNKRAVLEMQAYNLRALRGDFE